MPQQSLLPDSSITALKKLCSHPKLIYATIKSGSPGTKGSEDCIHLFHRQFVGNRERSQW
nr:protein CHROMATIN REMODELING 25 [Ipomoea batatas]